MPRRLLERLNVFLGRPGAFPGHPRGPPGGVLGSPGALGRVFPRPPGAFLGRLGALQGGLGPSGRQRFCFGGHGEADLAPPGSYVGIHFGGHLIDFRVSFGPLFVDQFRKRIQSRSDQFSHQFQRKHAGRFLNFIFFGSPLHVLAELRFRIVWGAFWLQKSIEKQSKCVPKSIPTNRGGWVSIFGCWTPLGQRVQS